MTKILAFRGRRHTYGAFHPHKLSFVAGLLYILLLAVCFSLGHAPSVSATQTVPYKLNFQGKLTDASGNAKAAGSYNVKFRLMSASSGGSNLWQADRIYTTGPTDNRITVGNGGLFSVQLGDTSKGDPALSPTIFNMATNATVYLEVELPTPGTAICNSAPGCATFTEGAMTPRSLLGSAAYAMNADTIDGIDGSSLARNDAANTFTANNTYNSGTTSTFDGVMKVNNTATVGNSALVGFNIQGTAGAYTLQNTGIGTYLIGDASSVRIGVKASATAGSSVDPTYASNAWNDVLTLANTGGSAWYNGAINSGIGWGENLISNPGFEFDCAGWTSCTSGSSNAHTGDKSGQITAYNTVVAAYSRFFAVQPGQQYYAEGWMKSSTALNGGAYIGIVFYDKTGTVISGTLTAQTNPGTSYIKRTVSATAPANAVYAFVDIASVGNGSSPGTFYFDDLYAIRSDHIESPIYKNSADSTTAFQIQNANGDALLVADTSGLSLKVGGGDVSPNATPALFVLDYKNTSGDPAGVNGAMYYNSNTHKYRCYENSAWKDCDATDGLRTYKRGYDMDYIGTLASGMNLDGTHAIVLLGGATMAWSTAVANHPGIFTGTAASSGQVAVVFGSNTTLSSGTHTFTSVLRIPTLSVSVTNPFWTRFGFTNGTGASAHTEACYLRVSDATTGGNAGEWQAVCVTGGSTTTCDTDVPATTNWVKLKIVATASSASFYIDGDGKCATGGATGPITSNIPTGVGTYENDIWKTGGITARTLDMDYMEYMYEGISR